MAFEKFLMGRGLEHLCRRLEEEKVNTVDQILHNQ